MTSTCSPSCLAGRPLLWRGCRAEREAHSLEGSSSSWLDFSSAERSRASGSPCTASSASASSGWRARHLGACWSPAGLPSSAPPCSRQHSPSPTAPPASQTFRLPLCWPYSSPRPALRFIARAASHDATQHRARCSDSSRYRGKRRSSSSPSPQCRSASTSRAIYRGRRWATN